MEEPSPEILLQSLQNAGVSIPTDVAATSARDALTTPETLVSICAQCLNIIDRTTALFHPLAVSASMDPTVDKLKICTDIALAIRRLGYLGGDISYFQLLYPSEEESCKLVRFLVERLPKPLCHPKDGQDNRVEDWGEKEDDDGLDANYQNGKLKDISIHDKVPMMFDTKAENASFGSSSVLNYDNKELMSVAGGKLLVEEDKSVGDAIESETVCRNVQKTASPKDQSSKVTLEAEQLQKQEKMLMEEVSSKTAEVWHLEEELELLKAVAEMAYHDQKPIDLYEKQLEEKINARRLHMLELESQWDAFRKPLEEKKRMLLESLYVNVPEAQEKLQKLREIEQEKQLFLSEVSRRDEDIYRLSLDLERQPKLPLRASYIEQIKEITKNSGKQDADIERILKETRELQLESNSIQERLHRTYSVLDEMVYREAKRDHVGRQAYRLLTSIHESFEQISEKILATDRVRREEAELEKKLAAMSSRRVDVGKLQADLGSILKENESLEQRLEDSQNPSSTSFL